MRTKRQNESYYQYRASCCIRRDDGSEEVKNYELDTDIMYGDLHFWNKFYYMRQSQNMLYALAARDTGVVKCKILKEELILIPRFTYKSDKMHRRCGIGIRKLLLIIEMVLLIFLNMTRPTMAAEKECGFMQIMES
ncbi:hypothetical protein [Clostridium sp. Marseille-P2415]|uniref:hypothetical protein n=1 Tax=Clostridium sp. Marseille-P2415 TaxID=1805471 RepID=UPI0009886B5C|nr:hypothetical protein [Clostridium sp. Marseille-P2415]